MSSNDVKLRPATPGDAKAVADIVYRAFCGVADRHNFPHDFASLKQASGMAGMLTAHPGFYGVVAESGGKIVGSNFLDERDAIRGVGPITVDPSSQSHGVGKALMQAVIDRGRGAAGVRLVQDAFNTVSMSLYTSLGFDVKEPLALLRGKLRDKPAADSSVRAMTQEDIPACAALCRQTHGFDRANELRDAVAHFHPLVVSRNGRITAYASAPNFWIANHGVAETETDLRQLLLGASAAGEQPIELLMPTRQSSLFRWCLQQGLRIIKPMTLMAVGTYHQPKTCFYPSVAY